MTPFLPMPDFNACLEFGKQYQEIYETDNRMGLEIAISVAKDSGLAIPTNHKRLWEKKSEKKYIDTRDCGTGSGGFQPGNSCAGEAGNEEFDPGSQFEREVMKNGEAEDIDEIIKSAFGDDAKFGEQTENTNQYNAITTYRNEQGQKIEVKLMMTNMTFNQPIPTHAEMNFRVNGRHSANGKVAEGEGLKVIRLVTLMTERYLATTGAKVEKIQFTAIDYASQAQGRIRLYDGLVKRLGKKMGASGVKKTHSQKLEETKWIITIPGNVRSKNTDRIITFILPPATEQRDCGTGAGGFQPGNSCAGGEGGGNVSIKDSIGPKQPGDWMKKKGYPTEIVNVIQAKAYAILIAEHKANGHTNKNSQALALSDLKTLDLSTTAADAFIAKYDLDRNDYNIKANTLKNDPGIYAAEKAIASGKIKAPTEQPKPGDDEGLDRPPVAPPEPLPSLPIPTPNPKKGESKKGLPASFSGNPKIPDPTATEKDLSAFLTPGQQMISGSKHRNAKPQTYMEMQLLAIDAADKLQTFNAQITSIDSAYALIASTPKRPDSKPAQAEKWDKAMNQIKEIGMLDAVTRIGRNGPPPAEVYHSHEGPKAEELHKLSVGETYTNRDFTVASYDPKSLTTPLFPADKGPKVYIKTSYGYQLPAKKNFAKSSRTLLPRNSRMKIKSKEWREIDGEQVLFLEVEQNGISA
jgi:hypothetical protein